MKVLIVILSLLSSYWSIWTLPSKDSFKRISNISLLVIMVYDGPAVQEFDDISHA